MSTYMDGITKLAVVSTVCDGQDPSTRDDKK
jgi:hypothetical protein